MTRPCVALLIIAHLEAIDGLPITYKLFDPADSHPANLKVSITYNHQPRVAIISHAPFRVREVLMVAHEVFLVERILLDALVILEAFEHNLAEAIEVRDITHLRVEELAHQCSRGFLVVDLVRLVVSGCGGPSCDDF